MYIDSFFFFFQAEDGIRDLVRSRGLGDVYKRQIHTLNKFCKMYIQGFDGAKELREKLMKSESTHELLSLIHI